MLLLLQCVSEEVSCHFVSINDSYSALNILNDLYEIHSELELMQPLVKLFNLELKNDDHMDSTSKIKFTIHNIDDIGLKIYLPLIAFIKALYPTYSHYLESLEASGKMKSISFDTLVENMRKPLEIIYPITPMRLSFLIRNGRVNL